MLNYQRVEIYRKPLFSFLWGEPRFSHSIAGEPIEEPEDGKTPAERRLSACGIGFQDTKHNSKHQLISIGTYLWAIHKLGQILDLSMAFRGEEEPVKLKWRQMLQMKLCSEIFAGLTRVSAQYTDAWRATMSIVIISFLFQIKMVPASNCTANCTAFFQLLHLAVVILQALYLIVLFLLSCT